MQPRGPLVLSLEPPPDAPRRCLPCRVHRDAYKTESTIQTLGVCLRPPPRRARRLLAGRRVIEADCVRDPVARHPGAGPHVICEVRWVIAHASHFGRWKGVRCHVATSCPSDLTIYRSGSRFCGSSMTSLNPDSNRANVASQSVCF